MRLTLRTMLAYLDDILEPDDRADLGKKIEDSEFATKLVHRIRDTTQRLRLGAPKLTGRGMGLDANTVAEYLDNTLSAERVPDFEKVCLESDVHLAEVAACHQVLTLVLGEPAEVEPALRRRMYQIGSGESVGVDSPHLRADQAGQLDPGHKPVPLREKPQIPDYLRDTKRSGLWTAAAILLLAAVVGGGLVLAVGPEKVSTFLGWGPASAVVAHNEHPPANAAANSNDKAAPDANGAHVNAPSGTNSGNPTPEEASPGTTNPEAANPNSADTKGNNPNSNPSVPLVNPADLPPGPTEPSNGTPGVNAATPASPTPNGAAPLTPDKGGAASLPPTNPPAPDNVPGPTPNPADVASNSNPPIPANPNPLVPKPPVPNPPAPALTGDTPAPANPAVVPAGGPAGVFVSDEDVLMKWNTNGFWERVAIRAPVSFGDALLAFPTYRPTVLLNFGVSLQIGGETFLTLEPADADGIPGLNLTYGRIILTAAGKAGTKMRIRYGEHQGLLTFGDGASEAAIEVRPYHTPGSNPEKIPSQLLVDVYANSGQITWAPGSTVDAEVMQAPARLAVTSIPGEALDMKSMPPWIKSEQVSDIDRRASKIFYKTLDTENSLQRLRELATHRNIENRALAIRCLAHLGEFEDLVSSLRDEDQKPMWQIYFEAAQNAIARNADVAAKLRLTLEKQRVEKSADLYRLFWGYSKADLEGGQAAQLVEDLNSDDLDIRVLSFMNLKAITGMNLLYRPEATAALRRQPVQAWQQRLKDGVIVPKAPAKTPG